ncbi:Uncharacterised protein [Mycobacteroides abscessus subsp. abscessus]|nr:Uncharacterised protein [Mycobacteroides abscessus subsp. abscessus]
MVVSGAAACWCVRPRLSHTNTAVPSAAIDNKVAPVRSTLRASEYSTCPRLFEIDSATTRPTATVTHAPINVSTNVRPLSGLTRFCKK